MSYGAIVVVHNISQVMSYVHGLNNILGIKTLDAKIPLLQIESKVKEFNTTHYLSNVM